MPPPLSTLIFFLLLLLPPKATAAPPQILSVTETKVTFLIDGEKEPHTMTRASLSTAGQTAVAQWLLEHPLETEPPVYDPEASYQERLKVLNAAYKNIPDNFNAPWPTLIQAPLDIEITIAEEDPKEKRYVYHSDNYEFICDVRLKAHLVKRFAVLFESTREFCRQLPITTKKAHLPGKAHRNKIFLFEHTHTYQQHGGPPHSAGVYMTSSDTILIPLSSLGVKKAGSSYTVDNKANNKVLPHELVHQLTDICYYSKGARGWFTEGLSQYVAATPYRSGKFIVSKAMHSIKEYISEYDYRTQSGRALGDEIQAPSLKSFMLQPYSSFSGANANLNYGLGLLITTYFFKMDKQGDRSAINAFLQALRQGDTGEKALEALLQGRTFKELEKNITSHWRRKGIKIKFAPSE